jgi:hypothetical protein
MSFLNQVIETTKESNKKYKMERAEYERASNVLYDIAERKLKKCVLQRAKDGYTDATFDVIDDLKLDIAGKWSIPELLFTIIFEDVPPVVSRLFYLSNSPFDGFAISTKAKDAGPPSTFVLDWAYAMLKPQSTPAAKPQPATPAKPQPAPTARPQTSLSRDLNDYFSSAAVAQGNFPQQSTPPSKPETTPKPAPKPAPPANAHPVCYTLPPLSHWDMGMFNTEESTLGTPPAKPNVQTPPGAPVKPTNPIVRDLFSNTSLPVVSDQQIMDYLSAIYGMANYPK